MVKFKEYSKRFFCILSVCVCFLITVFCPFAEFKAAESDFEFYLDYPEPATGDDCGYITLLLLNDSTDEYEVVTFFFNIMGAPTDGSVVDFTGRFEFYTPSDSDEYFIFYSVGYSNGTGYNCNYSLYEISSSGVYKLLVNNHNNSYRYDLTDYSVVGWRCGGSVSVFSTIQNVDFAAYYSDDGEASLLHDIKINLLNIYAELEANGEMTEELRSMLEVALYSPSGVSYLELLHNLLYNIFATLSNIKIQELNEMIEILESQLAVLDSILLEEQKQTTWLEKIWNSIQDLIGLSGDDSVIDEPVDDSLISDVNSEQDDLINGIDPGDVSTDITVDIDSTSNDLIWGIIDDFITANESVFTTIISILSLGIVALILGR